MGSSVRHRRPSRGLLCITGVLEGVFCASQASLKGSSAPSCYSQSSSAVVLLASWSSAPDNVTRPLPMLQCVMPSRQNPYVRRWMPALQCRIAVSMRRTLNWKFQHELFLFSQRIHQNQMYWRSTPEGNYSELEPMSQEKWEMLGGDFPGPRDPTQLAVSSEVARRLGSPAAIYPVRGTILA